MITQQLLDYIKGQTQQNIPPDAIKNILRSSGWVEADINEAFTSLATAQSAPPIITPPAELFRAVQPQATTAPDKKFWLIVPIVILLILIAGGAYAALVLTGPAPASSPGETPLAPPVPNPSPTAEQSATSTFTPVAAVVTQNCGSVDMTRMNTLNGVSAMNAQDKTALTCASTAFASCDPVTLTYLSTGTTTTSTLTINGLSGSYCSMAMDSNASPHVITCKVPLSLIADTVQSAKKSSPGDLFSYSVVAAGLFFSGMPLTNTQTGAKTTVECSSS